MVNKRGKKKWALPTEVKDLVVTINQNEQQENLRSLLYLLRREIKSALFVLETLICELENPNPPGVNPSERDISAMKRSLN
jgi:hypothetical protein